ncbi:MAG: hypothetical protein ABFC84_15045 [Veillonellales bacterium]
MFTLEKILRLGLIKTKTRPKYWGELFTRVATQFEPKSIVVVAKQKVPVPIGTRTIPALPPMLPYGQL